MSTERDLHARIAEALHRNATLDSRHITVTVMDRIAVLSGSVSNWTQRDAAERAASEAPGIAQVENRITIEPPPIEDAGEIC
jgi:osmotically-inducible protein OsmY